MLTAWCARRLEGGKLVPPPLANPLSRLYEYLASRNLARPLRLPHDVPVIGIGSAELGGAGKTPVAIAYARACAAAGVRTALVSHAYGAHPRCVRRVRAGDPCSEVGDEALVAVAALAGTPVQVWVGPSRERTLHAAARSADVIVVDGLLQARPRRVARSVLVLDARAPLGSGAMPPAGDLRAPARELLAACDEVVLVDDPAQPPIDIATLPAIAGLGAPVVRRAWVDAFVPPSPFGPASPPLRQARVGLVLTIARPYRVVEALRARGVAPLCRWFGADHRTPGPMDLSRLRALAVRLRLDGWLTSGKCAPHLAGFDLGAPIAVIQVSTRLDPIPAAVLGCRACARRNSSWSF